MFKVSVGMSDGEDAHVVGANNETVGIVLLAEK